MIYAIVCVDYDWGIGQNNNLLMSFKEDMSFFRKMTKGRTVVMGKNTFLSFPNQQPLKNRNNIVLSDTYIDNADITQYSVFTTLVSKVLELSKTEDVFIIGGAMMYKSILPYCDYVFVTKYDSRTWGADLKPDTFFTDLDKEEDFEKLSENSSLKCIKKVGGEEVLDSARKKVGQDSLSFTSAETLKCTDKPMTLDFIVYRRR